MKGARGCIIDAAAQRFQSVMVIMIVMVALCFGGANATADLNFPTTGTTFDGSVVGQPQLDGKDHELQIPATDGKVQVPKSGGTTTTTNSSDNTGGQLKDATNGGNTNCEHVRAALAEGKDVSPELLKLCGLSAEASQTEASTVMPTPTSTSSSSSPSPKNRDTKPPLPTWAVAVVAAVGGGITLTTIAGIIQRMTGAGSSCCGNEGLGDDDDDNQRRCSYEFSLSCSC